MAEQTSQTGKVQVVCLSNDLMMTGKISSLARNHNIPCRIFATFDKFTEFASADMDVTHWVWLIDLQRCEGKIDEIREMAEGCSLTPEIIGYAQHVEPELIMAGKQAGFDQVLTRGRFDQNIGAMMAGW